MAYVSYKTKRALGAKYSRPPEVELEEKRLEQRYAMMPEMAKIAEAKRQNNIAMMERSRAIDSQGKSSMIGTVGNVAGLGMQAYKAGLFSKVPAAIKAVSSVINPATSGITGVAPTVIPQATNLAADGVGMLSGAADAGLNAAMDAGVDISGSIVPNAVSGTSSGLLSGISTVAGYAQPAALGMAAKSVVQPMFEEAGRTVKGFGGVSEYAGKGIDKFLAEPMEEATLEGATSEMTRNVVDEVAGENNILNSWQGKTLTDIFDPVGTGLDWLKKGLAAGIGGLIDSIF